MHATAEPEAPARRRRALLVATATYADPGLAALRAPTGDVEALAGVLQDGSIGEFEVTRLVDRPTEELKKEIEGFFGEARRDDLLLLYFSCHGVLSQSRRFYFATATTALQWLRATAIEDGFINDVVQHSRARSVVLVLDCCHSGAFGKGLTPKSALTVDVEHRFEGRGRVTLSASTELEYAFEEADPATGINELEPAAPGSLFTRCLVDGLASGEADMDGDGRISVDELYDYVCQRMRDGEAHQTPGMAGDVRGEIVIARSRRGADLPQALK
ncbi:MAG: caspase family protein, partial [Thermoleophilia bacterium]